MLVDTLSAFIPQQKKLTLLLQECSSYTTGRRVFAEGLAKALQPSAKDLPRAALGEEPSGKKTSAKDSLPRAFYRALGIVFAEG